MGGAGRKCLVFIHNLAMKLFLSFFILSVKTTTIHHQKQQTAVVELSPFQGLGAARWENGRGNVAQIRVDWLVRCRS